MRSEYTFEGFERYAHDLKSALQSLTVAAEMASETGDPERRRVLLRKILAYTEKAALLADKMEDSALPAERIRPKNMNDKEELWP